MCKAWVVCVDEEDYKLFAYVMKIPRGSDVIAWCEEHGAAYCYICKDRYDAENLADDLNSTYRKYGIALHAD